MSIPTRYLVKTRTRHAIGVLAFFAFVMLTACGDGGGGPPATFTIGGTVTGLEGTGLVLQNNGGDDLAVDANGAFAFATALASGEAYDVAVKTAPSDSLAPEALHACSVANGSGTVGNANVTNVALTCTTANFTALSDGSAGFELWKTDGTEQGTVLVKDINPGTGDSAPNHFMAFNGEIYFDANDGTTGRGLWKSDGTEQGTLMVKDINSGAGSALRFDGNGFAVFNGALYFSADDGSSGRELWKSDGTVQGTVMVKDVNPSGGSSPIGLTVFNGALYFVADDGVHSYEIWKTDGTANGTVLVTDVSAANNVPSILTVFNGALYFTANDGTHDFELWKTDGTTLGTEMVKDINPSGKSSPSGPTVFNGALYFAATDDTNGRELWKTDGTTLGTTMVKDIFPGGNSSPFGLTVFNGALYFSADDGSSGRELWKSDGTTPGTVIVKDINSGGASSPLNLKVHNGTLYFDANDGSHGAELWKTDGTTGGTVLVKDINPGGGDSLPGPLDFVPDPLLTVSNAVLTFFASDGSHGFEIWRSDGTDQGTVMVKDVNPGLPSGVLLCSLICVFS